MLDAQTWTKKKREREKKLRICCKWLSIDQREEEKKEDYLPLFLVKILKKQRKS